MRALTIEAQQAACPCPPEKLLSVGKRGLSTLRPRVCPACRGLHPAQLIELLKRSPEARQVAAGVALEQVWTAGA